MTLSFKVIREDHVKITHFWLVGMNSVTQKTLETKKKSIVLGQAQPKLVEVAVQHHMTLSFKVIRKGHAFVTSWKEFPDQKNIRIKKNSIVFGQPQPKSVKVTYNLTWPWVSRSSVKVTHLWLVGIDSLTQWTLETKKNFIKIACVESKIHKSLVWGSFWPPLV